MESPVDERSDLGGLRRRAGAPHARWRQELGNVTPQDMPEWIQINSIDASPHDAATAYVAATMYQSDDFRPYLYKTTDYGKTWKKIVNGIPDERLHARDPRRSESQGPAGGGHGVRPVPFIRRRRELEAVPAESAGHVRSPTCVSQAREGTGGGNAGARVLGSGRHAAALPVDGTRRPRMCRPVQAEGHVSLRRGRARRGGGGRARPASARIRRAARWSTTRSRTKPQDDVTLEFLDPPGSWSTNFPAKPPAASRPPRGR